MNEKKPSVPELFGGKTLSWIREIDEGKVILFGPDTRSERSKYTIITKDTWSVLFKMLEKKLIKGNCKHVICFLSVPVGWPDLSMLEKLQATVDDSKVLTFLSGGIPGMTKLKNEFGVMELRDDLADHWGAAPHQKERAKLIYYLQEIAVRHNVRVTLFGGDVHIAGAAVIYPQKKKKKIILIIIILIILIILIMIIIIKCCIK